MIKQILIFILVLCTSLLSNAQKIKFTSNINKTSYIVDYQSIYGHIYLSTPAYEKIDFMQSNKIFFYKEGYYTQSIQIDDPQTLAYEVALKQYENPYSGKQTNKILVSDVLLSAKTPVSDFVPNVYNPISLVEETIVASQPFFSTTIIQTLKGDGIRAYKDEGNEIDSVRYVLSADVTHFWVLWKLYNPALVKIKWSVYDKISKRTVYTIVTEGASEASDLKKLLSQCISEATKNLIHDAMIQKYLLNNNNEIINSEIAAQSISIKKILPKDGLSNSEMIKKSISSTVTVKTENGHGSGFIVSADGYIITNKHVIENSKNIEVIFSNGFILNAQVIRDNSIPDVALLKIDGRGFPPFPLASTEAETGDGLIVIGTPKDISLGQTVTQGIVSGKREFQGGVYLQTDASINPGNSGGPILNTKGEVIGVATYKTNNAEGISFGIPIQDVIQALHLSFE